MIILATSGKEALILSLSQIHFVMWAMALILLVDVAIRIAYAIYDHFSKNRLLDEYTDISSKVSEARPPRSLRIAGFIVAILLNIFIYYVV